MLRIKTIGFALIATFVFAAVAQAQSPHFNSASARRQGNNLDVSFKESGLGNNERVDIQVSALATASYVCINNGGHNPSAANKRSVTSTVASTGTFSVKNGSVSGTLSLSPPAPDFQCPPGMHTVLVSVSYTNVKVTDTTNNVSRNVPGTF